MNDIILSRAIDAHIQGNYDDAISLYASINMDKYADLATSNRNLTTFITSMYPDGFNRSNSLGKAADVYQGLLDRYDMKTSNPMHDLIAASQISNSIGIIDFISVYFVISSATGKIKEYDERLHNFLMSWCCYFKAFAHVVEREKMVARATQVNLHEMQYLDDNTPTLQIKLADYFALNAKVEIERAEFFLPKDGDPLLKDLITAGKIFLMNSMGLGKNILSDLRQFGNVGLRACKGICSALVDLCKEFDPINIVARDSTLLMGDVAHILLKNLHLNEIVGYKDWVVFAGFSYSFHATAVQGGYVSRRLIDAKCPDQVLLNFSDFDIIDKMGHVVCGEHFVYDTSTIVGKIRSNRAFEFTGMWGDHGNLCAVTLQSKTWTLCMYKSPFEVSGLVCNPDDIVISDSVFGMGKFAHWILDVLPRILWASRQSGGRSNIILFKEPNSYEQDTLELAGIDSKRVHVFPPPSFPVKMKHGLVPVPNWPSTHSMGGDIWSLHPEAIAMVRQALYGDGKSRSPLGTRVYLPRGWRTFTNVREIGEVFERHGIETIDVTSLTCRQQIDLFYDVDLLVVAAGAGLVNMLYMRPGTSVICLNDNIPVLYLKLANIVGVNVVTVLSTPDVLHFGVDYVIDPRDLELALQSI